jgi:peptidoglycan/xylan/chitin deacetylase (PgdA/CDA1 family)
MTNHSPGERRSAPSSRDLELPPAAAPAIVTNTVARPWSRRRFMGGAVGLAALASFTTACGADLSASSLLPGPLTVSKGSPGTAATSVDDDLIKQRYWGLRPFAPAPAPPAVKPVTLSVSDPAVFSSVPMTDKVVFVTIDDGLEKEPGFIQMVKDFQVPITIELANLFIRDDYAYFEKLYQTGFVSIQNHTVDHPLNMSALTAAQQLDQIAGQQEILRKEYGVTPYVFRPPGGNYDETTVAATGQAGLKGVMLWKESMQISDMQYQTSVHRLSPGDIILAHFRGPAQLDGESMVHMMIRLFRHIQDQGFTIGNLEHYV